MSNWRRPFAIITIATALLGGLYGYGKTTGSGGGGGGGTVIGCGTGGTTSKSCLWISSAGSSGCVRDSSAVSYSQAITDNAVCDTGPTAYTAASQGDGVLVEGSPLTVTSTWNFTKTITKTVTAGTCNYNYGGTANLSNCVTIAPAASQSLTFSVPQSSTVGVSQVYVCVSGLSIQNATFSIEDFTSGAPAHNFSGNALVTGSGDNQCGTVAPPHDDYYANITYGGQAQIVGGVSDVYEVGGTATHASNNDWQLGGQGDNGAFADVTASGIVGIVFQGYNFENDSVAGHHMECVHANGAVDNSFVSSSVFEDCPVESLFFETLNAASDVQGNVIENNYFDSTGSSSPFKMDCAGNSCTVSNNIIRFNSFAGAPWQLECSATTGNTCTMDGNTYYGNLGIGCQSIFLSSGGTVTGTGFTSTGYNVQSASQANTCTGDNLSLYGQTISYVSPGTTNYNLDLSGAQAATNEVPNSVTWPLSGANIHGTTRSGSMTNAGAY